MKSSKRGEEGEIVLSWAPRVLLSILSGVLLLLATLWVPLGAFTIDEALYLLSAESFATGKELVNGLQQHPAFEIVGGSRLLFFDDSARLVSQYPPGQSWFASAFWWLFSSRSLFFLNGLALLSLLLCSKFLLASVRGFNRYDSCLLYFLVFFPFLPSALSIWPHSLVAALVLASFVTLTQSKAPIFAGLLIGCALLVRLDAVIAAAAIILIPIFRSRLLQACQFALGMFPGLLILSIVNLDKFGVFFPFAYSSNVLSILERHGLFLACPFLGLLFLAVPKIRQVCMSLLRRPLGTYCLLLLLVLGAFFGYSQNLYSSLFHLSLGAPRYSFPATLLGASSLQVFSLPKLSFFQNYPLLIVGLVAGFRSRRFDLLAVPLAYFLFFGLQGWHGGLSFEMRYLLPAVPFLALLSAAELRNVSFRSRELFWALPLAVVPAFTLKESGLLLDFSTLLALVLLVASLLGASVNRWLCIFALGFMFWISSFQVLTLLHVRSLSEQRVVALEAKLEDGALLLADAPDTLYPLKIKERVHVARLGTVQLEKLSEFTRPYFKSGRSVTLCCLIKKERCAAAEEVLGPAEHSFGELLSEHCSYFSAAAEKS